jgi:pilus assembly protein CpaB
MDAKKIALLVGALLIAGITAFMAKNLITGASAPSANAAAMPVQTGPQILVATRALPVGTILAPDSFRYQPWPNDLVEKAYFKKGDTDPSKLAGTVVRSAITAGQPITQGALVKPGDRGFLAAALGPGMRAVTVKTSELAGVAGFIFPGDRIDLLLTQTVRGNGMDIRPLDVSETILRNIRVLATDQRTQTHDEQGKQVVKTYTSVTLEVTPKMAEKIIVAQSFGDLTLSLRSLADSDSDIEHAIASGNVTVGAGAGKNPKTDNEIVTRIAARPTDGGSSYSTGADVSRFRRSTMPQANTPQPRATYQPSRSATMTYNSQPRMVTPAPAPKPPVVTVFRPGGKEEVTIGGK